MSEDGKRERAIFHSALAGLALGAVLSPAVQGGFIVHAVIAVIFAAAFGGVAKWVVS
jgi:ABC-type Mn2+/Zn2+ transport system permease subunit